MGKGKIQRKFLENTKGYDLNSFVEMELKKGIKNLLRKGLMMQNNINPSLIQILQSPRLLKFIEEALEEKNIQNAVIGEKNSKLTAFILCSAIRLGYPVIIIIKGSSSSGKTNLANSVTNLFKTKKIGELSITALKYSEDDDFDILYFKKSRKQSLNERVLNLFQAMMGI